MVFAILWFRNRKNISYFIACITGVLLEHIDVSECCIFQYVGHNPERMERMQSQNCHRIDFGTIYIDIFYILSVFILKLITEFIKIFLVISAHNNSNILSQAKSL